MTLGADDDVAHSGARRALDTGDLADDSTLRGIRTSERGWLATWARRFAVTALVALVVAASVGLLGVQTAQVSSTAAGYTLSVEYAAIARAGLDVPFRIQVDHADGFDQDITLAVDAGYFGIFETQGFLPEPAASVSEGDTVRLTFDPPPDGPTFVVNYDAYIQPASQQGATGHVQLLVGDRPITAVEFRTRVLP